jgi:hypothetical protein
VVILTSEYSAEELDVQHGGKKGLRESLVEVPVKRHNPRRLQAEGNVLRQVGVGIEAEGVPAIVGEPTPLRERRQVGNVALGFDLRVGQARPQPAWQLPRRRQRKGLRQVGRGVGGM